MTPQPDPRVELLRMSHPEAAEALTRINEVLSAPAQNADKSTDAHRQPQQQAPTAMTPEQARQAEGQMLLAAMRRDLPEFFADAAPTGEAA